MLRRSSFTAEARQLLKQSKSAAQDTCVTSTSPYNYQMYDCLLADQSSETKSVCAKAACVSVTVAAQASTVSPP